MKILITGANGYLGHVLTELLVKTDNEVTALVGGKGHNFSVYHYPNFKIIKGDVSQLEDSFTRSFDLIFYLAPTTISNLAYKRIIFTSSEVVYGEPTGIIDESCELKPVSWYGQTKVRAEKNLRSNFICFRLATLYGSSPRMRRDLLLNDFTYRAIKDSSLVVYQKQSLRNFVHVRDAARALIHGMQNWELMQNQTYNVCRETFTKEEICEQINHHHSFKLFINEDKVDEKSFMLDSDKLFDTEFRFKYTVNDGILELIKAYT